MNEFQHRILTVCLFGLTGNDWLLFPALLIMSLAGVPIRIANMQFSNLYPEKRSTIISIYSGAFSASSIIYVILQYIYAASGIGFFWVNFILVLLSLATIPFTLFILPADKVRDNGDQTDPAKLIPTKRKLFTKQSSVFAISQITLQKYKSVASPTMDRKNGFVNAGFVDSEDLGKDKLCTTIANLQQPPPPSPSPGASSSSSPPLSISLCTFAYNLHQLWFSWMITYMLIYVGSMNLWTERVTSDLVAQKSFVDIYGLFQVLALVVSPLAGLLMDWQLSKANSIADPLEKRLIRSQSGFWPLFITTITLLICVICHYYDSKQFIYISIVFITIYRAFLLAVGSAFLRVRFA